MIYLTLNEALKDIAQRSFYESATVTVTSRGYEVEDDFGTVFPDDAVMWTYDNGMELPTNASDHSPLGEPWETYATAKHIRYDLPAAVEALEDGQAVTFSYQRVETYPTTPEDEEDLQDGLYDNTVGWVLLAHIHDTTGE